MAWGVFDRPDVERRARFSLSDQPRSKVPAALLSDPAFSSDPRAHPHFNESVPHFSAPPPPPKARPKLAQPPSRVSRKAGMKALVRRLTSHHILDRIDELDETDPFGTNYHHDGPYEAISSTVVQPTIPHMHSTIVPRNVNVHYSKRVFNPRSLHPTRHQSLSRIPSAHGERGLSLHLEPGQILQQNTIYTSHVYSLTPVQSHVSRRSTTLAIVPKPDHPPSRSSPTTWVHSLQDSSWHISDDLHNLSPSLPRAPLLGDNIQAIPQAISHCDRAVVPFAPNQTETTAVSLSEHESRMHDPSLPQPTLSPSTSRHTQSIKSATPVLPPHDPGLKNRRPLDRSHMVDGAARTSFIQNKSLEFPRTRHLPKRLVMPSPLQPQSSPQPQYEFPPAERAVWRSDYAEEYTSNDMCSGGRPSTYNQGPGLLRKKSSVLYEEVPMLHGETASQTGQLIPTTKEDETTKEKIRRRRLSKRKNIV